MICVLASVPSLGAYTVDDFIGKKCTMVVLNPDIVTVAGTTSKPTEYQRWGHASYDCEVVAGTGSNQIVIKNFLGVCDMPMTLNATTGKFSISTNRQKFPVTAGDYADGTMEIMTVDYLRQTKCYVDGDGDNQRPWNLAVPLTEANGYNMPSDKLGAPSADYGLNKVCDIVCKFNRSESGPANSGYGYEFIFTKGRDKGYMVLGEFDLFFYAAGQSVTHNVDGKLKTYGLRTDVSGNTLSISNLMDLGVAYRGVQDKNESLTDWTVFPAVQGEVNGSAITIPVQKIGGTESGLTTKYGSMKYASGATGTLSTSLYALWLIDMGYKYYDWILASEYVEDEDKFLPITGRRIENGVFHANHNDNYWCTNGGTTTTHTGSLLELGKMAVYSYSKDDKKENIPPTLLHSSDGLAVMESKQEITHVADVTLDSWSLFSDNGLSLDLTVSPAENLDYVEDYELYLIDGAHTSIVGQELDTDTGLKGAVRLDDFRVADSAGAPALKGVANGAVKATYTVPAARLRELGWGTDVTKDNYTVFLKANYTRDSALASTFHDMTTTIGTTPTGMDDALADRAMMPSVTAGNGYVDVAHCGGRPVEVFTPQGTCLYSGAEGRIALPQGICVVRVGNSATKVAVR